MNGSIIWRKFSLLLGLAVAATLTLGGCGTDSYSDPNEQRLTRTDNPLIEAATLKSWFDAGLVNAGESENVVILHVSTPANYNLGHIPGAYFWDQDTELFQRRLEALSYDNSMTVDGQTMDRILQRSGVNHNSTIVLSYTGTGLNGPARAYFHLRYWGFPKERIKFLNGGNNAWSAASWYDAEGPYALTAEAPSVQTSTFSVRNNRVLRSEIRYSLGEMIQAVDANIASIDAGKGPVVNIIHQTTGTPAISTAIGRSNSWFSSSGYVRSAEEIKAILLNQRDAELYPGLEGIALGQGNFVEGLPSIVHCGGGSSATPIFFAMEAILGWNIALYDGSTGQWNVYRAKTGDALTNNLLVPNSSWRTDLNGRSTGTANNNTDLINPYLNFLFEKNSDPRANQVENEDAEYMGTGSDDGKAPPSSGDRDTSGC